MLEIHGQSLDWQRATACFERAGFCPWRDQCASEILGCTSEHINLLAFATAVEWTIEQMPFWVDGVNCIVSLNSTSNKCIASSNKCLTSSNKKLLEGITLNSFCLLLLLVRPLLLVAMHLFLVELGVIKSKGRY